MRSTREILVIILATACATAQSSLAGQAPKATDPPEIIVRQTSWEDAELAAKGLGRVEISVRVADHPARAVESALVIARVAGQTGPARQVVTDARGVAMLDSLAVGRYEILVRSIGYGPARTSVDVLPGCRTDVEAYIGIAAMGIDPAPPEPGKIRITTCRASR